MVLQKVSYSVPNLKNLVNSSNSCVYCIENCSRSLTVTPVHLNNIKRSVNQLLSEKVTTYDPVLKGIILGHKNIKVINHVQLNDDGNFALDFVADIYIFKPEVGSHLSGEVNKKSKDHIGVLVHSFFNVSIPRPRNDTECPKHWIGFDVNIGQSVIFEVVKVNFSGRLPYIKGKLIDMCEVDFEDRDSGISGHESMEENSLMKDKSEIHEEVMKKKKKKKRKSEDIAHQVYDDNVQEQVQDSVGHESKEENTLVKDKSEICVEVKKKKKKRKSKEMAHHVYNDNEQEQDSADHENLEDGTLIKDMSEINEEVIKKKKNKKRKSENLAHQIHNGNLQEQEQDSIDKSEEVRTSDELIDALMKEANNELINCSPEKKKKKKKKKVSCVLEDAEAPSTSCITAETTKSKKRKFSELESFQGTEPSCSLNSDEVDEIPVPKKKKKKKHSENNIQP